MSPVDSDVEGQQEKSYDRLVFALLWCVCACVCTCVCMCVCVCVCVQDVSNVLVSHYERSQIIIIQVQY